MPKAGLVGNLAGLMARIPVRVHTFTGQVWANQTGLKRALLKLADKTIVSLCSHVFTDSESQSQFLSQNGINFKGLPLPVLGHGSLSGVDLKRFNATRLQTERISLRKRLNIKKEDLCFGFIGRKCKDKGIFELLQAYLQLRSEHKNTQLLLVGPDESNGALTQFLDTLPKDVSTSIINIELVSDTTQWFAVCDILCLPSYREGFGSVVLEAAALGIPTIGSNIPGLRDAIVNGKTGLLVEPKNVLDLGRTMALLINNRHLLTALGTNAEVRTTQLFSSSIVYRKLADFYKQELSKLNT